MQTLSTSHAIACHGKKHCHCCHWSRTTPANHRTLVYPNKAYKRLGNPRGYWDAIVWTLYNPWKNWKLNIETIYTNEVKEAQISIDQRWFWQITTMQNWILSKTALKMVRSLKSVTWVCRHGVVAWIDYLKLLHRGAAWSGCIKLYRLAVCIEWLHRVLLHGVVA